MRKLAIDEMNRISVEEFKKSEKKPIIVVLENIRSLNNIGAIFRTADAFLLESIYLTGITASPPHREIQKTALGATESVDWKHFDNTEAAIEVLKKKEYQIFALEQAEGATDLKDITSVINKKGVALILGNEVSGVEQSTINLCDRCIEIEQHGTKHSLNVSISGGIAMWELFKCY